MQVQTRIRLAWSYFFKHLRQYIFLISVMSLGFAIITVVTSLIEGMTQTAYGLARNHYGGDIVIHSDDDDNLEQKSIESIDVAVEEEGLNVVRRIKRLNKFQNGKLYFAGNSILQKNIVGIDWENERPLLKDLNLLDGSLAELNEKSILISQRTAEQLKARVGDDIVMEVHLGGKQINTVNLVLSAIFIDNSAFNSYKSLIDITTFRTLFRVPEENYSLYGLFFDQRDLPLKREIHKLYSNLENKIPLGSFIETREDWEERESLGGDKSIFLVPLTAYISEIDDLLEAMRQLSYGVYAIIILIILVSIMATYRIIIQERSKELATIRAIGIQKRSLIELLLTESFFLFLFSLILGAIWSAVVLFFLSELSFAQIPGFEIFLRNGRLLPIFSLNTTLFNVIILLLVTFPAVFRPSLRAADLSLVDVLSVR